MRHWCLVVGLLSALLVGCGGDRETRAAGAPVVAPAQETLQLAAVQQRAGEAPTFNPPRFDLVTLREDGSQLRTLISTPRKGLERLAGPAWSPDGKRIYFVGALGKESDLLVVEAGQGEARRITSSGDVFSATPSPDGTTLLVSRFEDLGELSFAAGLWLMDADGGQAARLLDGKKGQLDVRGSWSPDGRRIAFTRCRFEPPDEHGLQSNTCGVYSAAADGSDLRKLADRSADPAFSPDGKQIAFVSDRDENGKFRTGEDEDAFANELYVMGADGTDQHRLSQTASLDEAVPSWSPDGSRIIFAREGPAAFNRQLMVVRADGSCPTLVIGDASDYTVKAVSFEAPSVRPGRVTGTQAPLACD